MSVPLFDKSEFANKVALVTGGSAGMGEHLTRTLAGLNCDVFFCARGVDRARALAAELGPRAHFVPCDLADTNAIRAFADRAAEFAGGIDYLVNNAGSDPRQPFEQVAPADFDRLVATDLRAYFFTCQAAMPALRKGAGKAIVNVGTTNYLFGNACMTTYGAAKAGIFGFTRQLARELGPDGIRVNLLSPGWIMTKRQLEMYCTPEDQARLLKEQCVKELMTPEHVTPVTLFLLSGAARALSGQQIVVDGGYWLL